MTDNLPAQIPFAEMERLAVAVVKSKMFGIQTVEQALTLMAVAQAEGRHPALAARDYDIIQGRPSKKAEAMLRDFLGAGGKVDWIELEDHIASATFSHPSGGTVTITWDMERARQAGMGGKDMWKKFPRQMLRSRVLSEGVRTVFPAATSGMYVPEEVAEFAPQRGRKQAEPEPEETSEVIVSDTVDNKPSDRNSVAALNDETWMPAVHAAALTKVSEGTEAFKTWYKGLVPEQKAYLKRRPESWLDLCAAADEKRRQQVQNDLDEFRKDFYDEPLTGEP